MMNRPRTPWVKRIATTVAATASLGMMSTAIADTFSDYQDNFNALAAMFDHNGKLPLFSDESSSAIIRNLTDQEQLEHIDFNNDFTAARAMQGLCSTSGQLTLVYLGQGINFSHSDRAEITKKLNENGYRYQDEVTAAQSFSTACMGKAIPVLTRGVQTHTLSKEQQTSIAKFRVSTIKVITGELEAAKHASIKPENKEKLLQSLATAMPNLIGPLPMDVRLKLKAAANETKAAIPAQQQHYLDDINRSIATTACTKACQLILN